MTIQADVASPLAINPDPIDFSNVRVGQSTTRTATVTNNDPSVSVDTISAATDTPSGPFTVDTNGCAGMTLAPADHCDVVVRFSPTSGDPSPIPDGTLNVSGNVAGNAAPASATLKGAGVLPLAAWDPTDLSFATGKGSTSPEQTIQLVNGGSDALSIGSNPSIVGTNPGQFALAGGSCASGTPVPAGGSCSVKVTYSPAGTDPADATLSIDTEVGTRTAGLHGVVSLSDIQINPATGLNFRSQQDGTLSSPRTIAVTNKGNGPLNIFGTRIVARSRTAARNFVIGTASNCAGTRLGPNETCVISVRFAPHGRRSRSAKVRIASDVGKSDLFYSYVNVSGTGVAPPGVSGLRGAVGCTAARLTWVNPDGAPRFLRTRIVRNARRAPRGPGDGMALRHRSSSLTDSPLQQLHTYYYGVWGVYRAWDSDRLVYSKGAIRTLRTGRVCTPMNGSVISDLTPLVDWTAYSSSVRLYAIRVVKNGDTILIRFPKRTSFQFQRSWTYGGKSHSLVHGGTYYAYVYAYTRTHPNGRWIGQTKFTER